MQSQSTYLHLPYRDKVHHTLGRYFVFRNFKNEIYVRISISTYIDRIELMGVTHSLN